MQQLSAILLAILIASSSGIAAESRDRDEHVVALFSDLPEKFVVVSSEEQEKSRSYRLRSAEPISHDRGAPLFLHASVTVTTLVDEQTAAAEVGRRLAEANPELGLSYAWDFVIAVDNEVVHLNAACTFSEEHFGKVARKLVGNPPLTSAAFTCKCGGGCRPGAPLTIEQGDARRLPPVRRAAGIEDADYDNRLDPSGSWVSDIGVLSLMHYADKLSFSYSAVFGSTAHLCEGAGIAGLVATDRYDYPDEQGRVVFTIDESTVRMELLDGIASFCGAGWAGDRFEITRFEPPLECSVAAGHSHFHVVDTLDLERRRAYAVRGDAVAVAPAQHTGDDRWVLGRFVGPLGSTLGLLLRDELECPASPTRVPSP